MPVKQESAPAGGTLRLLVAQRASPACTWRCAPSGAARLLAAPRASWGRRAPAGDARLLAEKKARKTKTVSYTHLRAHETR
eukprot:6214080-Prorocentrum_lima.AAC.1